MGMLELENQFLAPHPKGTDVWHSLPKTNQRSESPKSKLQEAATAFEVSKVWEQIILVMRGSGCVYCLSPILSVTWSSWIILLWTRTDSLTLPELCSSSPVKCKTDSSTLGNMVCFLEVQSKEASTFCLVLYPLLRKWYFQWIHAYCLFVEVWDYFSPNIYYLTITLQGTCLSPLYRWKTIQRAEFVAWQVVTSRATTWVWAGRYSSLTSVCCGTHWRLSALTVSSDEPCFLEVKSDLIKLFT